MWVKKIWKGYMCDARVRGFPKSIGVAAPTPEGMKKGFDVEEETDTQWQHNSVSWVRRTAGSCLCAPAPKGGKDSKAIFKQKTAWNTPWGIWRCPGKCPAVHSQSGRRSFSLVAQTSEHPHLLYPGQTSWASIWAQLPNLHRGGETSPLRLVTLNERRNGNQPSRHLLGHICTTTGSLIL